jgi:hypothetical protein
MSPSDRVAQLYPQASGSLSIIFYNSQGYGEGILTHLHTGYSYTQRKLSHRKPDQRMNKTSSLKN